MYFFYKSFIHAGLRFFLIVVVFVLVVLCPLEMAKYATEIKNVFLKVLNREDVILNGSCNHSEGLMQYMKILSQIRDALIANLEK